MTALNPPPTTWGSHDSNPQLANYQPHWRFLPAGEKYTWVFDGSKAIGLIAHAEDVFELRCHGPLSACPPAELPKHYHTVTYQGVRIVHRWRLEADGGQRLPAIIRPFVEGALAGFECEQAWRDGSRSLLRLTLSVDPIWQCYVAEVRTTLKARRLLRQVEYCNLLPAGLCDSRPEHQRYQHTFWQSPQGLLRMGKNPLWWCSVGAQDFAGQRRIVNGGFVSFGVEPTMNPVLQVIHSDPPSGIATCDRLQDEHIYVLPSTAQQQRRTGWYEVSAHYQLKSAPQAVAQQWLTQAKAFEPGPLAAWKFQYPPTPELPDQLLGVELPGSPFYGSSDWSQPVPWDQPYQGRLWTASPDPQAAIHYDRTIGRTRPGSIRLRVSGEPMTMLPASGYSLHTRAGKRYRFAIWIRCEGNAQGWIEAVEMLFSLNISPQRHASTKTSDHTWQQHSVEFVARGDDAPFVETLLCAQGQGQVWFTDLTFTELS